MPQDFAIIPESVKTDPNGIKTADFQRNNGDVFTKSWKVVNGENVGVSPAQKVRHPLAEGAGRAGIAFGAALPFSIPGVLPATAGVSLGQLGVESVVGHASNNNAFEGETDAWDVAGMAGSWLGDTMGGIYKTVTGTPEEKAHPGLQTIPERLRPEVMRIAKANFNNDHHLGVYSPDKTKDNYIAEAASQVMNPGGMGRKEIPLGLDSQDEEERNPLSRLNMGSVFESAEGLAKDWTGWENGSLEKNSPLENTAIGSAEIAAVLAMNPAKIAQLLFRGKFKPAVKHVGAGAGKGVLATAGGVGTAKVLQETGMMDVPESAEEQVASGQAAGIFLGAGRTVIPSLVKGVGKGVGNLKNKLKGNIEPKTPVLQKPAIDLANASKTTGIKVLKGNQVPPGTIKELKNDNLTNAVADRSAKNVDLSNKGMREVGESGGKPLDASFVSGRRQKKSEWREVTENYSKSVQVAKAPIAKEYDNLLASEGVATKSLPIKNAEELAVGVKKIDAYTDAGKEMVQETIKRTAPEVKVTKVGNQEVKQVILKSAKGLVDWKKELRKRYLRKNKMGEKHPDAGVATAIIKQLDEQVENVYGTPFLTKLRDIDDKWKGFSAKYYNKEVRSLVSRNTTDGITSTKQFAQKFVKEDGSINEAKYKVLSRVMKNPEKLDDILGQELQRKLSLRSADEAGDIIHDILKSPEQRAFLHENPGVFNAYAKAIKGTIQKKLAVPSSLNAPASKFYNNIDTEAKAVLAEKLFKKALGDKNGGSILRTIITQNMSKADDAANFIEKRRGALKHLFSKDQIEQLEALALIKNNSKSFLQDLNGVNSFSATESGLNKALRQHTGQSAASWASTLKAFAIKVAGAPYILTSTSIRLGQATLNKKIIENLMQEIGSNPAVATGVKKAVAKGGTSWLDEDWAKDLVKKLAIGYNVNKTHSESEGTLASKNKYHREFNIKEMKRNQ